MSYESLIYESRSQVAWITLNRPEALNAMNASLLAELPAAVAAADADPDVWVIVLTGKGRAFCAGADLKNVLRVMNSDDPGAVRRFFEEASGAFARIEACNTPIIAAVNGIAAAGGLELILSCDLVMAAESARIGDAHANYGVIPGGGGTVHLPMKVGPTRAKQLLYTGELLPAATLLHWGLVNEVVPDDQLEAAVTALAERLAAKSPLVLRRMKELVADSRDASLGSAQRAEIKIWEAHCKSADVFEGLNAFSEKRQPVYSGK